MTDDWWSVSPPRSGRSEDPGPAPAVTWDPEPELPVRPVHDPQPAPEAAPEQKPDRRRSLILGAAGAAAVGILVFTVIPHDGTKPAAAPGPSMAASHGDLPPAAGGGPQGGASDRTETSGGRTAKPKTVTLSATPSGSGRVGAVVKVVIMNNTDEAIVVMSSMLKGDNRPAVIGEGTLAPGSRRVEPGKTVQGTVEFAVKKAPSQIVLMDISGNVVAASG